MGIGVSIFLITLGLILKFAVNADALTDPVDVHVSGVILVIVGGLMLALQLVLMLQPSARDEEHGPDGHSDPFHEEYFEEDRSPGGHLHGEEGHRP